MRTGLGSGAWGALGIRGVVGAICAAGVLTGMATPARAVVQGRDDAEAARYAVMILGSKGGFCSAVVVAPTVVLTAGHCVRGAPAYRIHYKTPAGQPVLLEPAAIAVNPGFVAASGKERRKTIDLALVLLREPLPAPFAPARIAPAGHPRVGDSLTVGGYGLGSDGVATTGGTFRTARLGVIEPYGPGNLLVWLTDPATGPKANGSGACGGDSGGPITGPDGAVIAVTAFAEGAGAARCGALTQGVLLPPQRDWIAKVLAGWNQALAGGE